jgi:hypothetical protein
MDLREYFDQDKNFSESTQELMPISEMAFPHAFNAWWKLCETYHMEFYDTRLNRAFMERLSPSSERIRDKLKTVGYTTHVSLTPKHRKAVRAKFYRAAKALGVKVTTHAKKNWVEAEVVTGTQVRVKGEKIA